MVEIGPRTPDDLLGLDRRAADVRPPLSPRAVDRIIHAARAILASAEGLAAVPGLPAQLAAPIIAPDALRLRQELTRAGVIREGGQ